MSRTDVDRPDKRPNKSHWFILKFSSYWSDGGYPGQGSNCSFAIYDAYENEAEWRSEVTRLAVNGDKVMAGYCKLSKVTTKIDIDVKVEP